MPATDEDILRDLMQRCTDGVHPPASITTRVVTRQRRRQRRGRALSIAATGAALGTAAGVVAIAPGQAPHVTRGTQSGVFSQPAVKLTAAQRVLYRLSSVAAGEQEGQGRYVVLSEKQDNYLKTSVIDGVTGDLWTYQKGAGVPEQPPVDRHGSPTQAEFAAMPTDPAALRAVLISQFDAQQKQAEAAMAALGRKPHMSASPAPESGDDKVFGQATGMLWNPLVGPALRSALFRVLATTPGVKVDSQARDNLGRPAVEISRFDSVSKTTYATFEDPTTTVVLEQTYTNPPNTGDGPSGFVGTDLYLSTARASTIPPNPYGG
jgi:hypothetical protein